uniref:Thioredoxin family protein n=1 Tax=candidate division WOR-3 bacterium TaxID=2052148 RepID=A0A7C2K3F6_UNCW3
MKQILILGSGCPKCKALEKVFKDAVAQLGDHIDVVHIYDPKEFAKYGVMITPAAVINGKVVVSGRVPGLSEALEILKTNIG